MAENTKSEKDLEKEIEEQAKGQTTAVPTEKDGEDKTEPLDTRANKAI